MTTGRGVSANFSLWWEKIYWLPRHRLCDGLSALNSMKLLRLLAAALPLFTASLWAANHEITTPEELFPQLDAILKHAVAQSPAMVTKATDLEIAENDRVGARASLLPSAGGFFTLFESSDKRSDQVPTPDNPDPDRLRVQKVYYNFSISQPIFHWGERRNLDRIGAIRLQMAQRNYREGYRLLAQEVRSSYLRLIGDKQRAKRATLAHEYYGAQLKRAEEQFAKKAISEAQIFPIRLDAERAEISDEQTRYAYENNKITFSRLTGLPVLNDDAIPDSIPAVNPQDAAVQKLLAGYLAQKDKPTVSAEVARQSLAVARLNLANDKKRLYPKLSLTAGVSQDEQSYTINIAQKYSIQSYYAGLSVNWLIFDGFNSGAVVRSTRARIRQLETDYRALDEQLARNAQNQAKALGFSARYAAVNERQLESVEGTLNLRREEFGRGVISEEAVSMAELNLVDARISAFGSRADYYTQLCEFLGMVVEDPVVENAVVAVKK
jgi:outer membrane protein TolC